MKYNLTRQTGGQVVNHIDIHSNDLVIFFESDDIFIARFNYEEGLEIMDNLTVHEELRYGLITSKEYDERIAKADADDAARILAAHQKEYADYLRLKLKFEAGVMP